jgi:hypothetical protein
MRKLLLALLLFLAPALAGAQQWVFSPFRCIPKTALTPLAAGSWYDKYSNANGSCYWWWCEIEETSGTPPVTAKNGYIQRHCFLKEYAEVGDFWPAAEAVAKATDVLGALNSVTAAGLKPPKDAIEAYRLASLRHEACLDAVAKPLPWPFTLRPDPCGAAPTPPTPPVTVWKTPAVGGTIYTYAAGRLSGITSRKAPSSGALCNCDVSKAVVGPTTYCALASGPPNEVTACVKVTP